MRISRKVSIIAILSVISLLCTLAVVGTTYGTDGNMNANVNITPSLLVTIPSDTVSLNLDPFTSAFGTANLPITVSTNNPTGFTLNMSASETDLTLVNGSETIPTLADKTGGYSEAEFTANRWGYKLSTATNYSPFALSNQLLVTDSPSNASVSTINFASKVDATKPAGTYELTINFTAVANYVPPTPVDYCVKNGIADADCMQKMVASNCTTTAKTVMDSRDGEQYKVQRLADGKCWLLDNLRLDPTEPQVQVNLSVNTTNASDQTLNYLLNGGGTTSDKYPTAGLGNLTEGNSFSVPRINVEYKETVNSDASKNYGEGSHMYGVYYNYCAASAGSYCYGNGNSAGTSSGNAEEDICPAGWRMPTGGSSGEYQALFTAYNNNQTATDTGSLQYNLSTPISGYFRSGSASGQGSGGSFLSSTGGDGSIMFLLGVDSSSVDQYTDYCSYGYSVRCLLK